MTIVRVVINNTTLLLIETKHHYLMRRIGPMPYSKELDKQKALEAFQDEVEKQLQLELDIQL